MAARVHSTWVAALVALSAVASFGACAGENRPAEGPKPSAAAVASGALAADAGPGVVAPPRAAAATKRVRILAMNDLHGHLQPPTGGNANVLVRRPDGGTGHVTSGGAAFIATHLRRLRAENPDNIFVHAGDLTGATPLETSVFHDEPAVLFMNQQGLRFNAVGNHEFDHGLSELRRFQNGGCFPGEACTGDGGTFPGATFRYLAANVSLQSGATLFPPYEIAEVGGERIAFVGMTLEDTPAIVAAANIQGVTFRPEAATVNALVPELRAKGASSIVVLIHQGSSPPGDTPVDGCGLDTLGHGGVIAEIAKALDPAVDVVVSAHTHRAYVCELGGKIVTSAASYGRVITAIDLTFDTASHRVVAKTARNVAVTRDVEKDRDADALAQFYATAAAPRANRVVGHLTADLLAHTGPTGESNFGDLIADAMLAATAEKAKGGAVIAFMNTGGIRADLRVAPVGDEPPGTITYGKLFAAQPFGNVLTTVTLTGAQIAELLEEQFRGGSGGEAREPRFLQPSKGLTYSYDKEAAAGRHVVAGSLKLNGKPIDPKANYRVTVSDFLYTGGDGYRTVKKGTNPLVGPTDLVALEAYFATFGNAPATFATPTAGRLRDARRP